MLQQFGTLPIPAARMLKPRHAEIIDRGDDILSSCMFCSCPDRYDFANRDCL